MDDRELLKVRLRSRLAGRLDLRRFLAEHPHLDAETRAEIIRAVPTEMYGGPSKEQAKPYSPRDYLWSPAEVYVAHPGECRECYTARPYPAGQRHFGWALWRDCRPDECGHAHHANEVWIA